MDLNLLLSAFLLIAVTELGDKSSLAIITLASRYDRKAVFLGSFSALMLMTVAGIILGTIASELLPRWLLLLLAALLFLAFGAYSWINGEEEGGGDASLSGHGEVLGSFLLLLMMEMGDKTQVSVLTLSATGDWLPVLIGAGTAFLLLVGAAVLLGDALGKRVRPALMSRISGALFLLFGLLYMALFLMEMLS